MTTPKALALLLSLAALSRASDVEAIVDFTNQNGQVTALSNYMADELSLQLMTKGDVTLVDRGQLKKVLREQGLQVGGAFDEATIAKIGKLLGATKIVTGNYYPMGDEFQVIAKTIDVTTGKVAKAEKLKFPKSESTVKLDQTVFAARNDERQSSPNSETGLVSSGVNKTPQDSPLKDIACSIISDQSKEANSLIGIKGRFARNQSINDNPLLICTGSIASSTDGTFELDLDATRLVGDNGFRYSVDNYGVGNSTNSKEPIDAGIPAKFAARLAFEHINRQEPFNGLKSFPLTEWIYTFNGKKYKVRFPAEIERKKEWQ